MAVYGYVLKGRWRYLERDWVAEQGGFVYVNQFVRWGVRGEG
jgi:hypothetical protein